MQALAIMMVLLWSVVELLLWWLIGPTIAVVFGMAVLIGAVWAWIGDQIEE